MRTRAQVVGNFRRMPPGRLTRRAFLRDSLAAAGALAVGSGLGVALPGTARAGRRRFAPRGAVNYGPLQPADANGIELPAGFGSRVVATSGQQPAAGSSYVWHSAPDGGDSFPLMDGGWIYASNSEASGGGGGVGALRFDVNANVIDAYGILSGTSRNCAGGPTPWGTWLSCEEVGSGHTWECDVTQPSQGVIRPALGTFNHEAVAVDPVHGELYLTEDRPDGLLYRFTPSAYPDLTSGTLEAAEAVGADPFASRPLVWHPIANPNPSGGQTATRYQAPDATPFAGGEGIYFHNGFAYFTTKIDNRVWMLDTVAQTVEILYDWATSPTPILTGVDNVFVTSVGDVFVAEDGGNMEIIALTPTGSVVPVLRVTGQSGSEITGPALNHFGNRLYFSSQRGGPSSSGITYEITGPFLS